MTCGSLTYTKKLQERKPIALLPSSANLKDQFDNSGECENETIRVLLYSLRYDAKEM